MGPIKTAIRVCEIFELFEEVRRPLRLKDFTNRFQYPPSSASGLLKSLVELGYLEYDLNSRCYLPTMRMPMISSWIERARFGNGNVWQPCNDYISLPRKPFPLDCKATYMLNMSIKFVQNCHSLIHQQDKQFVR